MKIDANNLSTPPSHKTITEQSPCLQTAVQTQKMNPPGRKELTA
jgi:hypothetical protein